VARIVRNVLAAALLILVATAWMHNVSMGVTEEDARFVRAILAEQSKASVLAREIVTFSDEIDTIQAVQDAVLAHAPIDRGLPLGVPREPRSLYHARHGLCYDRSRTIEKALALLGYEARHVAVYSTRDTGSSFVSLVTRGVASHAVTEVRTSKGWLVVDSNSRWFSLDSNGRPWSMADLQNSVQSGSPPVAWSAMLPINDILARPFTYVIGLYSRHGRFYPPFTPLPDVNWRSLGANFLPI